MLILSSEFDGENITLKIQENLIFFSQLMSKAYIESILVVMNLIKN